MVNRYWEARAPQALRNAAALRQGLRGGSREWRPFSCRADPPPTPPVTPRHAGEAVILPLECQWHEDSKRQL